jgi:ADP-ribose pyrophosphatase
MSEEPATTDGADDWAVVDSAVEYECPWFSVGYDRVRRPDGELADYYWIDLPDSVAVVAVTDDGSIVLVEEYRPTVGAGVCTVPAGGCGSDESFETAAARELREETGFVAGDCTVVSTFTPSARFRQTFAVVLATDLTREQRDLDDGEFIAVRTAPYETALAETTAPPTLGWSPLALLLAREEGLL